MANRKVTIKRTDKIQAPAPKQKHWYLVSTPAKKWKTKV